MKTGANEELFLLICAAVSLPVAFRTVLRLLVRSVLARVGGFICIDHGTCPLGQDPKE